MVEVDDMPEGFLRRLGRSRRAGVGAGLLGLLAIAALVWSGDPAAGGSLTAQYAAPGWAHWMGTDLHGRDVMVRLMAGVRVSLVVGLMGSGVSLVIGLGVGAVAGYRGGRWDSVLMRGVDVLYAMPSVLFVMVLISAVEEAVMTRLVQAGMHPVRSELRIILLLVGLGGVSWLNMARIVRGQVLSLRGRAYVEAAKVLGAGDGWILRRHVLPQLGGVVLAGLVLTLPSVILYESFLSFLGLGIEAPRASLGSLMAEGAAQLNPVRAYWWLVGFPAGAMVLILLGLNLLADGVREALD